MKIKITIRYLSNNYSMEVDTNDKIESLCKSIERLLQIENSQQILSYNNRALTEYHRGIEEVGIQEGDVIYLKKRLMVKGEEKKPSNMMSNPMVKGFLKNPDSMKNIMEMFPGLKEEMSNNSELRSMMKNGNIQEEIAHMSENPNYMNEQMKNFDLTLSKLENMPGGFNMINNMLKDVQDPISSALEDSLRGRNSYKEGTKIDNPITEPVPGASRGSNHLLRYKTELSFLRAMGFEDPKKNLNALVKHNGDLNLSVDYLKKTNGDRLQ